MISFIGKATHIPTKWAALLVALTVTATGLLLVANIKPVFASYTNTYPWGSAPCAASGSNLGKTTGTGYWCSGYNWGENPCPSGDGFCTSNWLMNGYYLLDKWGEGFRNCVSYTAWTLNQVFGINTTNWGNGADWNNSALAAHYTDDTSPRIGDIAQWDSPAPWGHVAYVYNVVNGVANYAEYNYGQDGKYLDTYTSASGSQGAPSHYIHIGNIPAPPSPAPNDDFPTPAVMDFNSKENAFGRGTDKQMYVNAWQSGSGWSGFSNMQTNSVFSGNPAAINFNGEGDVFARGTDNQMYKSTWNGTAWGGFSTLQSSATFASDPVAYQFDTSTLNLFAVGTDNQMWEISKDPSWETSFSLLQSGAYFVGKPAVIKFNGSEYVVGRGTDNEIYVDVWTSGTGWSGFTRIAPSSTFASDPTVFVFNNVLNIFARGTDNQMYVNYFDTSWHPFSLTQSGALFSSNPTVAQFGGSEYVFARGTDNKLYGNAWTSGTGWSGFSSLGTGTFTGNPVAIQYGTNLDVFAIGTDTQMWVNSYDTSWHLNLLQSGSYFYSSSW